MLNPDDWFDPFGFDQPEIDPVAGIAPIMSARMRKGGELVCIEAYDSPRLVIENYPAVGELPGVVREIPYGTQTPMSERFADSVLWHEHEGWTHVPAKAHS